MQEAAEQFAIRVRDLVVGFRRHVVIEQRPERRVATFRPYSAGMRAQSGNSREGWGQWLSFGARPQYFFTEHLSVAFEAGLDRTSSGNGQYEGWLRKFTIAPQIGAGRKFFSRPVLRAFLTYANWSDGLRGFVGGDPYLKKTNGLTYGIQAETWW